MAMTTQRRGLRYRTDPNQQKTPAGCGCSMVTILDVEASGGFEPPIRVLQTPALPLGYDAGELVDRDFTRFNALAAWR
jgi:hypothetical protein